MRAVDKDHKQVLVAGLDGDFRREPFGEVTCGSRLSRLHRSAHIRLSGPLPRASRRPGDQEIRALQGVRASVPLLAAHGGGQPQPGAGGRRGGVPAHLPRMLRSRPRARSDSVIL